MGTLLKKLKKIVCTNRGENLIKEKQKLYLDIDDTILDTENFLRDVLGGKWAIHDGLLYQQYSNMSEEDFRKVEIIFSNYPNIPFITSAPVGLKILKEEFDLVLCSSYHMDGEKESKEIWAKMWGIPLILCKGLTKDCVDMSNAVFVDDNTLNLDRSNASRKICFYKKHHFYGLNDNELVFNWFELIKLLCPHRYDEIKPGAFNLV